MQANPINHSCKPDTNFKSAIPVVFWEKVGKEYKLVDDYKKVERMQDILVRRANGTGSKSKEAISDRKRVMKCLYNKDRDYRICYDRLGIPNILKVAKSIVGSFYPKQDKTGWLYGKFNPFVYLMTGVDKIVMEDFGKKIGRTIRKAGGNKDAAQEVEAAKAEYIDRVKRLTDSATEKELHVIMENGKKRYRVIKLDMYPKEGPKSPYAIMGLA